MIETILFLTAWAVIGVALAVGNFRAARMRRDLVERDHFPPFPG